MNHFTPSLDRSYTRSFIISLAIHGSILFLLLLEGLMNRRPVLENRPQDIIGQNTPVVKAVAVNSQEVANTVARLKQEKMAELKQEQQHQKAAQKAMQAAQQARQAEQKKLQKLKQEMEKIAILKKKQIQEEERRLKTLVMEKAKEAEKLKKLKNKKELIKADIQNTQKKMTEAKQTKPMPEATESNKTAQAAMTAQMSGEVDKYKAMILNAIAQQWIVPDTVDHTLSSAFEIHLAPDGSVLSVMLTKSSGNAILDRSAQAAIYKASPLPVPQDPTMFSLFRNINLTVRPDTIKGV